MTEHIPEKGFDLMEKIKKIVGRIIRIFITIDPGPFAPTKYILTAEYSREKSYLLVFRCHYYNHILFFIKYILYLIN